MLSLVKSTLPISLALIAVVSAVPQGLGFDDYDPIYSSDSGVISDPGFNLNYGSGSSAGYGAGLGLDYSSTTEVPVSPITIVPETDFLPINNVQPIVNIFPPNVNDYSYDYNYSNNYDNYDGPDTGSLDWGLGGGGYTGGLGGDDFWNSGLDFGGGGLADLGTLSADIPTMMGGGLVNLGALGASIPVMMGGDGDLSNLGALSAGVPGMVNPADLGALSVGVPPMMGMANAADVSGIIAGF